MVAVSKTDSPPDRITFVERPPVPLTYIVLLLIVAALPVLLIWLVPTKVQYTESLIVDSRLKRNA